MATTTSKRRLRQASFSLLRPNMTGYLSNYFVAQVGMGRDLQLHALDTLEKAAVSILVILVIGGRLEGLPH